MVCLGQGGRVKYYSAFLSDLFIDSICTCALPRCIYRESQRMQLAQKVFFVRCWRRVQLSQAVTLSQTLVSSLLAS